MAVLSWLPRGGALSDFKENYVQVEYIQSSGTQYIDTGVCAKSTLKVYMDFQLTSTANCYLFGNTATDGSRYALCYWSSKFGFDIGSTNTYASTTIVGTERYQATFENGAFTIGDVTTSVPTSSFTSTNIIRLFGRQIGDYSSFKLYSFKMEDNGVLVRNFVPCYRKSDYVAGLYDMVNEVFYTNKGTGDFITEPKDNAVFLYNNGDECTALTGGWKFPTMNGGNSTFDTNASNVHTVVRTKNADNIQLKATAGGTPSCLLSAYSNNAISLDGYSKLCAEYDYSAIGTMDFSNTNEASAYGHLSVYSVTPNVVSPWSNRTATQSLFRFLESGLTSNSINSSANDVVVSVDITEITGKYWVNFWSYLFLVNKGFVANVIVKRIWLE